MSDADITVLVCVPCAAPLPVAATFCPRCGARVSEQQRRSSGARMRAQSVTAPPLVGVVRDVIARLRRERPASAQLLIVEGEEIAALIEATEIGEEERAIGAASIFDWNKRALDLLLGGGYRGGEGVGTTE